MTATFGYNPAGTPANPELRGSGECEACLFTAPADMGTAVSISFIGTTSGGAGNFKGVIYKHSDLSLIAVTNSGATSAALLWRTAAFGAPVALVPGTEYLLGTVCDTSFYFRFDAGAANQGHLDTTLGYASPHTPFSLTAHQARLWGVYCTYNQAGWSKKIMGITPAKVMGISSANIGKIMGV